MIYIKHPHQLKTRVNKSVCAPNRLTVARQCRAHTALIHARTSREAKTHRGVHVQFARLTTDAADFDVKPRQFLAQAYDLKKLADYATGPEAAVPLDRAAAALAEARPGGAWLPMTASRDILAR